MNPNISPCADLLPIFDDEILTAILLGHLTHQAYINELVGELFKIRQRMLFKTEAIWSTSMLFLAI